MMTEKTQEAEGAEDEGSVGLVSAVCDDGKPITPLVAGFGGVDDSGYRPNCLLNFLPARYVPDPDVYNFRYRLRM